MGCNYPAQAFQLDDGSVVFDEIKHRGHVVRYLRVPCGKCDGCRLERSRQWAVRCMHEAQMHEQNCVITLTYNDEHLPDRENLQYTDFQLFMKRLRKKFKGRKIRFFMCGEYGENRRRPHFHACLFGIDFDDKLYFKTTASGTKLYTSRVLNSLWSIKGGDNIGYATIGTLDFASASYIARYVMKKVSSNSAYEFIDIETGEVSYNDKEFNRMSLKKGIGESWYRKYKSDVFPKDICVINGVKMKPPKYYTKLLAKEDPLCYDEILFQREKGALEKSADNTLDRLEVKEKVLKAKLTHLKRELSKF